MNQKSRVVKRFVNICKINGCEKCKWRVDKAALQKILNRETEEKIEILKEEKCRLEKERQQGTKRFNFVVEQLKEKEEMKRPVKDRFEDADEDDQELVMKIEKPFRRERSFDLEKVRVLFGMGPEPPRMNSDPMTPKTDRKKFLEVDSDVLAEYQLLKLSETLEKVAFTKSAVEDHGKLTYRDMENALSGTSGKLTRRRCERVFEKLCLQQRIHDAWWKKGEILSSRSIRVDQRKDTINLSTWSRGVEQGAVLTDFGIDTMEKVKFTYKIHKKADSTALDSLCLGVSLRPPVLRYDTAGSTLICIKVRSKGCQGPDFFVDGESLRNPKEHEDDGSAPEEQLDRIPFDLKPGDRVTFTLDRLADDEGLKLGSLSVSCNGGEEFKLIRNLASVKFLRQDEALFPMAYASLPPAEIPSIAELVACDKQGGDDDD